MELSEQVLTLINQIAEAAVELAETIVIGLAVIQFPFIAGVVAVCVGLIVINKVQESMKNE